MMRTIIATLVALVLATGLVLAQGTLSVPFTAEQQAGVLFSLNLVNADRAAQDPVLPPLGLAAYGIAQCQAVFTSYVEQRARARESQQTLVQKYLGLNDANKTSVEAYINACISSGTCA